MKFGKQLRETVDESYEEWRPMFLSYKKLKKSIIPQNYDGLPTENLTVTESDESNASLGRPVGCNPEACQESDRQDEQDSIENSGIGRVKSARTDGAIGPSSNSGRLSTTHAINLAAVEKAEREHAQFFTLFRKEVDKVNDFFLDKQEDFVIEHEQLCALVRNFSKPGHATRAEMNRLRERLTNFHGQLILLENFSTVNYTGFRKILKKLDKKTGLNVQRIYLHTALVTPFYSSDVIQRLIGKTERQLHSLNNVAKFRRPNFDSTSLITAHQSISQKSDPSGQIRSQLMEDEPVQQIAAASDDPTDADAEGDAGADADADTEDVDPKPCSEEFPIVESDANPTDGLLLHPHGSFQPDCMSTP